MRRIRILVAATAVLAIVGLPTTAGAVYDKSNPSSTGCITNGAVSNTGTALTFGAFKVELRRSTGCATVWAVVTRTDTKVCQAAAVNCAKVKLTRYKSNGTKAVTVWRKMVQGTNSQFSLQFDAVVGARYVGTAATFGGTKIGDSRSLTYNANGTWTVS